MDPSRNRRQAVEVQCVTRNLEPGRCDVRIADCWASRAQPTLLDFGFLRPAAQLFCVYGPDGQWRLSLWRHVEAQRVRHGNDAVVTSFHTDLALDETDDIAVRGRLTPPVGAANARCHVGDTDVLAATMGIRQQRRGEAEGALDHVKQAVEEAA